jgi:xanthine dehydrogenase accessory factor
MIKKFTASFWITVLLIVTASLIRIISNELNLWNFISSNLEKQNDVILLCVLESKGSSPGRQGFMMAVNAAGQMCGSLGGGIMEYKFVELAKEKLKEESPTASIHPQNHDKGWHHSINRA